VSPRVPSIFRRIVQGRGTFATSEDGTVLVLWAMFLAVALGFLALSFDLGRVAATQSELQSYADQVALAAAGELDGRSDAITRATAAASGLVSDWQTYATGANALAGAGNYTLTFLRTLPTDDRAAATATTTNATLARYVRVQVLDRSVVTGFAGANATLTGRAGTNAQVNVAATATAGMTSWACDVTPLFFCAPNASWRASANIGDQILLRSGGGGSAAWGAGNFGFLDVTSLPVDTTGPCNGLSGANLYRCLVGAERGISTCIRTDAGVDTQPGQRVGLAEAFNTRFDHFRGTMASERTNANYRPAPNTIQGTKPRGAGATCRGNNTDPSAAMPLPRDGCLIAGTCGRFGDGSWNRAAYVTANHGGTYPPGTNASSSRYQMYLAEIAAARARTAPNNVPLPGFDETGAPQCHASVSPDPDRRTVIAAAIDCTTNVINGSTQNVVPLEYVKLFMTEPVLSAASDVDIMVEVVNTAGGVGSGAITGVYNDFIQLYR
jgi:Putative Flp pilus-assembly TadE/G-like